MMRVRGEVGRLAAAGDDHAGPALRTARRRLHRRGEMHQQADGADGSYCMMHETNQLSEGGLAAKIDHSCKGRVVVRRLADLDELNAASKVSHDLLMPIGIPPLDGVIALAARDEQLVRLVERFRLTRLCEPLALHLAEVNIPLEVGDSNSSPSVSFKYAGNA
jgi:hypothetical protein